MNQIPAELISVVIVLIIGGVCLYGLRKWQRRTLGDEIFKRISLFSTSSKVANPLAEAEVYLAYGRKRQAILVLEQGLRRDPTRIDIQERLAQIKADS